MKPREWKYETELGLEIVKRESEEREERLERDWFWIWNADPTKVPARKERAS